jgi:hypothetical protein
MMSIKTVARIAIVIFYFLCFSQSIFGQWTDYGIWSSASISKNISDHLDFSSETQARSDYGASRLESAFTNFTLSRKLSPSWKLYSALRLGMSRTDDFALEPFNRISVSARYKRPLTSNLSSSLKVLYQINTDVKQTFRLRPTVSYKVSKKLRFSMHSEFFFKPSQEGLYLTGSRVRFLVKHKVSKRRWISFGYQIDQDKNTSDPWTQHVLICSYDLELKRRIEKK